MTAAEQFKVTDEMSVHELADAMAVWADQHEERGSELANAYRSLETALRGMDRAFTVADFKRVGVAL